MRWASGSNSGIICTGVDAAEGTLERALIRDSIAQVRTFYRQMNLPMRPCGSLVCKWTWDGQRHEKNGDDLSLVLQNSHDAGDLHVCFRLLRFARWRLA